MPKVILLPSNKIITVNGKENLLDIILSAGIPIDSRCSGKGKCGKCKVLLKKGIVHQEKTSLLSDEEISKGIALACSTTVINDTEVEILPQSIVEYAPSLQVKESEEVKTEKTRWFPAERYTKKTIVEKFFLSLPHPTLTDNLSDVHRLRRELKNTISGIDEINLPLNILRKLPSTLRNSKWNVTVSISRANGNCTTPRCSNITNVEKGKKLDKNYALAIDIGTTTISGNLINLETLELVSSKSTFNSQISYGEDVITRIIFTTKRGGLKKLQTAVVETLNGIIYNLISSARIVENDIGACVIAGNTTMEHILLGIPPDTIRKEPYAPVVAVPPAIKPSDVGLRLNCNTPIILAPSVSSFVGGDITAGVLATEMLYSDALTLFIDMGTNGEIVLGNKDWLVSCSCSTGPAFEGVGIKCGMRATKGAVEKYSIDIQRSETLCEIIGDNKNTKPLGLCGSGLISVISSLLSCGIIDRSGNIHKDVLPDRITIGEDGNEFVLFRKNESSTGDLITITESDIKNILRSKSAIYAGCEVMLQEMGLDFNKIDHYYIAGGFGSSLDIENAVSIGLLPDIPRNKFKFLGNTSLSGARLMLASEKAREDLQKIAQSMTYIELSVNNLFMDRFMAGLFLPHTELEKFPSRGRLPSLRITDA